jgi:hypothetical protein
VALDGQGHHKLISMGSVSSKTPWVIEYKRSGGFQAYLTEVGNHFLNRYITNSGYIDNMGEISLLKPQ